MKDITIEQAMERLEQATDGTCDYAVDVRATSVRRGDGTILNQREHVVTLYRDTDAGTRAETFRGATLERAVSLAERATRTKPFYGPGRATPPEPRPRALPCVSASPAACL